MTDVGGPMHFEANAADYARARPPYPSALWDELRARGLLEPGHHALDLGAGTGQATGPLLAAGLRVTAVEPGPQLAARLAAAHPAATVLVARAEDVDLDEGTFDLAVAATSIHWLDLDVVLPRVHRLLRPGGSFLVWRHVFGDPAAGPTPFRARVAGIVQARTTPPRPGPDPQDVDLVSARLTRSGRFVVEETALFRWTVDLDEAQVRLLFSTFSDWTAAEVAEAAAAVRDLGGSVVEHYQSWLIVSSRVTDQAGVG